MRRWYSTVKWSSRQLKTQLPAMHLCIQRKTWIPAAYQSIRRLSVKINPIIIMVVRSLRKMKIIFCLDQVKKEKEIWTMNLRMISSDQLIKWVPGARIRTLLCYMIACSRRFWSNKFRWLISPKMYIIKIWEFWINQKFRNFQSRINYITSIGSKKKSITKLKESSILKACKMIWVYSIKTLHLNRSCISQSRRIENCRFGYSKTSKINCLESSKKAIRKMSKLHKWSVKQKKILKL